MFESMTYEKILNDTLARVPDDMDKRQSAIIYDAIAPACAELAQMYIELDNILTMTFADTSTGEYLERRTSERGITREPATKAVVKLETSPTDIDVPMGSVFSCEEYNFVVTEKLSDGVYQCECEELGSDANACSGQAIPNQYIQGLKTAYITEILKPAEDEESDESLRKRYMLSLREQPYGGNIADYKRKVHEIEGVGGVKVTPVWQGGGTVLLTISDSDYNVPSQYLIDTVQQIIDPTQDQTGVGIAPIGHIVTVKCATSMPINVKTKITYAEGYDYEKCKESIDNALETYYLEERTNWEDYDDAGIIIRISQIETRILACNGVMDIEETMINGVAKNLQLDVMALPVYGSIEVI
jgi:uncharacterized phage protein gp47/JayE